MRTFKILVTQTVEAEYSVEAETLEDAKEKAMELFHDEKQLCVDTDAEEVSAD